MHRGNCTNVSSVLTSMNNILYSVFSYYILNDVQSAVVRQCTTSQMHVYEEHLRKCLLMCLGAYVFLQEMQKGGNVISYHFLASILH